MIRAEQRDDAQVACHEPRQEAVIDPDPARDPERGHVRPGAVAREHAARVRRDRVAQARRDPAIGRPERRRVEVADHGARQRLRLLEEGEQRIDLTPSGVSAGEVGPHLRREDVDVHDLHRLQELAPVSGQEARHPAAAPRQRDPPDVGRTPARDAESPVAARVGAERACRQRAPDRVREPRPELLDAQDVHLEGFQHLDQRDRIGAVVAKIRAQDSDVGHAPRIVRTTPSHEGRDARAIAKVPFPASRARMPGKGWEAWRRR
ncbi:MAG TPA: hypothetical protein VMW19_17680 [Myxococcota bacterium]|nr:hypothetical protein [Myxococcota bacterium]